MKQRILVCLTVALLMVLGLCGAAMAADFDLRPEVELSEYRFSGPKEITVTITIRNASDKDMPGPMALYDPNGKQIVEFGQPTLAAGASKSWTGTWTVTDKQLADGRITWAIVYEILDASGQPINKQKNFYKEIVNVGATAEIEVKRTITPSTARNGQKVSVIYEISNIGGVDVTDVTIKESSAVASSDAKVGQIKAGEKATHTFTITMGKKNLISRATVTYRANDKSYTKTVEDATIKYGNVKLEASLTADKKGGVIGETMTLTLTLKNTGKVDYQNITVTDPILGTVFSGLTVEAGKSLKQEKVLTITQNCDFQFTVSGSTASGDTVETATERISAIAVDPSKQVQLSVTAEPDKSTIYMLPGIVKFTVRVTNVGPVDSGSVTVSASNVDLYTFEKIAAGQTVSFVRDIRVSTPGKFRFDARTADPLGAALTFYGNEVPILYAAPTATPSQVPIATPARPVLENLPTHDGLPAYMDTVEQVLGIGRWVLLGLSAACLALVVVGIIGRSARAAKSSTAADHLERDGYSDYTQAVPSSKRRILPETDSDDDDTSRASRQPQLSEEPVESPAPAAESEEPAADMQEMMDELYPDANVQDELNAPAAPAEEVGEVTYRRRRRTEADE